MTPPFIGKMHVFQADGDYLVSCKEGFEIPFVEICDDSGQVVLDVYGLTPEDAHAKAWYICDLHDAAVDADNPNFDQEQKERLGLDDLDSE